ncbi:hypothetical protein [Streptomyces sp. NPDC056061]|uniref:hypothetical protein n=1 Tax=Streptomyces sp. NPDC056061 TaxID=3345700 RepID=UPI0035D5CFC4
MALFGECGYRDVWATPVAAPGMPDVDLSAAALRQARRRLGAAARAVRPGEGGGGGRGRGWITVAGTADGGLGQHGHPGRRQRGQPAAAESAASPRSGSR